MSTSKGSAAPASGTSTDTAPTLAELAADPEIARLIDFEPVPVKPKANGWDADAQRAFIALLAVTGSKLHAARALNRHPGGIDRILKREDAAGFIAAHDRALDLFRRNNAEKLVSSVAAARREDPATQAPGQKLNEYGEYEDEDSLRRRGEEAIDSIAGRLTRIRRLFLQEISGNPGKRAAFEILTELPIDWDVAARGEPQEFEPWWKTNQREPDMVLAAESGWTFGDIGYGPAKMQELREAIDACREEEGLPPVDWGGE